MKYNSINELPRKRLDLVNRIISQGQVVVTDRLHASIISLLMGKPHVMLNEMYRKVQNTRETAFRNKPDCESGKILGFYVDDIEEAIEKAIELVEFLPKIDINSEED